MKIDKEKVKERLAGIPESKRSHIYDASIVLEFLAVTFMPTKFFLPQSFKPTPGMPLGEKSMRKISEDKNMLLGDLYDLYRLFREEKDYTTKIESRYIFSIIVKNLRYYKNHWEFVTWRVGVAQIWHIGPLVMRKDVPAETRSKFAARNEDKSIEGVTVEADPVSEPEEDDEELPRDEDLIDDGFDNTERRFEEVVLTREDIEEGMLGEVKDGQLEHRPDVDRFQEATGSRFKEMKYDPEMEALAREEY